LFDQVFTLEYLDKIFTENGKDLDRVIDLLMVEDSDREEREATEAIDNGSAVGKAIATVARMFPDISISTIEAIINRNSLNVEASIDEILKGLESTASSTADDANLSQLCEIFQGESISILESALKDSNGSIDGAIRALSTKDDASASNVNKSRPTCDGACINEGFPCIDHSGFVLSRGKKSMPKISAANRKFLVSSNLTGSPSLALSSESADVPNEIVADPQAARDAARQIASERAILFHKVTYQVLISLLGCICIQQKGERNCKLLCR
jgi:hypothetical protein